MTASEILERLRRAHLPPEWAFFGNVRSATGYSMQVGYADAMAFNLYPSRGLTVRGFEIKISRSDWLRELKAPDKAAQFIVYSDEWWIATPDKGVVEPAEIPATWGWVAVGPKLLRWHKPRKKLPDAKFSRAFMHSILRMVSEQYVDKSQIEPRIQSAYRDGGKAFEKRLAEGQKTWLETNQKMQETLTQVSDVLGGYPYPYMLEELKAVWPVGKAVRELRRKAPALREPLQNLLAALAQAEAALPQEKPLL